MASREPKPITFPFPEVLRAEHSQIGHARHTRDRELEKARTPRSIEALPSQFVGLAFSGGGIRSATFNLGVLQGLAELGLLPIIDYLSTVSGGGYIGTWLTAWIRRKGFPEVVQALKTARPSGDGVATDMHQHSKKEPHQTRWLREYSNYLTPKLGLVSGDTWAFIGAYLRNLFLNQLILGLALLSLLLLPRPFVLYFWRIAGVTPSPWKVPVVAGLLMCVALGTTLANLSTQAQERRSSEDIKSIGATAAWIDILVVLPILAALWLLWAWFWSIYPSWQSDGVTAWKLSLRTASSFMGLWLVGWVGGEYVRALVTRAKSEAGKLTHAVKAAQETFSFKRFPVLKVIIWAWPAGLVGGLLVAALEHGIRAYVDMPSARIPDWQIVSWGFPVVVVIFLFMQTLHIGLVGRDFSEDAREWWGRLAGSLMLGTLSLSALLAIALDGPFLIRWLGENNLWWTRWLLAALWAAITGGGLAVGKSTAKPSAPPAISRALVAKIAPPVFVLGLLLILSTFAHTILRPLIDLAHGLLGTSEACVHHVLGEWPKEIPDPTSDWGGIAVTLDGCLWFYIVGFAALALFLSWRTGINRFSMHSLYRNRLVRCYLGASNSHRRPQLFVGMDPGDDSVRFDELLYTEHHPYAGPYPIYNTALNMVSGKDLAWQQRKAASFVFTPEYSGFEFVESDGKTVHGLQPTAPLKDKLKLGLAMAISGAAASPNMGSHSTPALAFLMTVFNVRLGWWLGNPIKPKRWAKMSPRWGLFYLIHELLGNTSADSDYVYLSDGGHFENLALYELVRRQCRFIIVCDAGEDHQYHFEDLGNAIERCRADFGVDIEIDIEQIRAAADSKKSKSHCAVGMIHYEKVLDGVPAGTLLYLKSSLTGDEPADVQSYSDQNAEFPHQTTADQWFTESQFESYRALGHHVVESAIGVIGDEKEIARLGVEGLFVQLRQHWHPPSRFVAESFTKHTATYTSLLEKMRTDRDLHFLSEQVYPEWPSLMGQATQSKKHAVWLPHKPDERRAGFYFCNEVIQLMEDAYLDLNLEADYDHPDNRGWMNLFRHWSWSGMFKATWAISVGIYGARFQNFCARRLDLNLGDVELGTATLLRQNGEAAAELKPTLDAQKRWDVDFWEATLISEFVNKHCGERGPLSVVPFQVIVTSPREQDEQELRFNVGFALLEMDGKSGAEVKIAYFRIQDHLRKMGLGRAALAELVRKYGTALQNNVRGVRPKDVSQNLNWSASMLEAHPSHEAELKFKNLFASAQILKLSKPTDEVV